MRLEPHVGSPSDSRHHTVRPLSRLGLVATAPPVETIGLDLAARAITVSA
ncbi:hypothetical protein J8N05_41615 [Streptomyces sp. BH-SS-21]|uniref:Uncharacterized protein n=1 Tax=Streptomyces liliiviolaceus TaxID=2823109 RepID=A0A940Y335_9ACTN|nr:hypothetical protein [Streptomyces liliiviolaceus]MBQ0854663.1 hypothetical protein [Streptomyces liliiviolaceus]